MLEPFRTNLEFVRAMPVIELAVLAEGGCPPRATCPDFGHEIGLRADCVRCWEEWLGKPFDLAAAEDIASRTDRYKPKEPCKDREGPQ